MPLDKPITKRGTARLKVERGRALAVELLRHLEKYQENSVGGFQWSIEAEYREEGTRQVNVVLNFLCRCKDPEVLAGFASVLTDYIGSCAGGVVPPPIFYEVLTDQDISGSPDLWPTMDELDQELQREQEAFRGFMREVVNGARRI